MVTRVSKVLVKLDDSEDAPPSDRVSGTHCTGAFHAVLLAKQITCKPSRYSPSCGRYFAVRGVDFLNASPCLIGVWFSGRIMDMTDRSVARTLLWLSCYTLSAWCCKLEVWHASNMIRC